MKNNGFSLLELTVALGISAGVMLAALTLYRSYSQSGAVSELSNSLGREALAASFHILRVGRFSESCFKTPESWLQCRVDLNKVYTQVGSDDTNVRFRPDNSSLNYEQELAPGAWTNIRRFGGIVAMELCSTADLLSNATDPVACSIQPTQLQDDYKEHFSAANNNRFFRYRLIFTAPNTIVTGSTDPIRHDVQGAFYVRNPTLFNDPNTLNGKLSYQYYGGLTE